MIVHHDLNMRSAKDQISNGKYTNDVSALSVEENPKLYPSVFPKRDYCPII